MADAIIIETSDEEGQRLRTIVLPRSAIRQLKPVGDSRTEIYFDLLEPVEGKKTQITSSIQFETLAIPYRDLAEAIYRSAPPASFSAAAYKGVLDLAAYVIDNTRPHKPYKGLDDLLPAVSPKLDVLKKN